MQGTTSATENSKYASPVDCAGRIETPHHYSQVRSLGVMSRPYDRLDAIRLKSQEVQLCEKEWWTGLKLTGIGEAGSIRSATCSEYLVVVYMQLPFFVRFP